MRTIHVVSEADRDLYGIGVYLQSQNATAAAKFVSAVEETLNQLAQTPEIGALCPTRKPSLEGLRMWTVRGFKNFLIFYRHSADVIEVVRVLHGARNWVNLLSSDDPA